MSFLTQKSFLIHACTDLKWVSCDAGLARNKIHAPVVQMLNNLTGNLLLEFNSQAAMLCYLTLQQTSLICQNGKQNSEGEGNSYPRLEKSGSRSQWNTKTPSPGARPRPSRRGWRAGQPNAAAPRCPPAASGRLPCAHSGATGELRTEAKTQQL